MQQKIYALQHKANLIRNQILEMIVSAGKGHIGGAFSCTDILTALYYGDILRVDPAHPHWAERDRFILSKGHAAAALYAVLSDLGFFASAELRQYGQPGCMLGGHPDKRIPGVEADTGSLGHGLGLAAGLAFSAKLDRKDFLTVALLGDGECCEGSVWEAAMFAAHHQLRGLVAILDQNGQCVTDYLQDCTALQPLDQKWQAFGWDVRVIDGHSFEALLEALKGLRQRQSAKPLMIVAHTVKGKGVSFMEGVLDWHHNVPKGAQIEIARKELTWV